MIDYEDVYLSEIERRNMEAITRITGYKFPERLTEDDANDWVSFMDGCALQDPRGFKSYMQYRQIFIDVEEDDRQL